MPNITLPDGKVLSFDQAVTAQAVAESIGAGLARAAVAAECDGVLIDLSTTISQDATLRFITKRDPEALDVMRHSCAHLLAQAVQKLYPGMQVTIGPVIDNGFYYDFHGEHRFTPEDLPKIEAEMKRLVKAKLPIERLVLSREQAIEMFAEMGEKFKVEIIQDLPENETLSIYKQGDFSDLCRGPHLPNTMAMGAFKLTKIAGAYWRGDSSQPMLQRLYGTAWQTQADLTAYLDRLAEAERRDHRVLAKKMDLFHIQEEAPGSIFWHPHGWSLYNRLRDYMREQQAAQGFKEINTPMIVDLKLWQQSGHAEKFSDDMFTLDANDRTYAIKPMNCPCHVQVFNQGLKSYRDLPIKFSEFGCCHRNEPSGTLHGLMRLRGFVQDDGHIFCRPDQIDSEAELFITSLFQIYKDLGFTDVQVKLSTRPEKRVGSDEAWDLAEKTMAAVLDKLAISYEVLPGEGAFYGPKYEFSLCDCLGRVWQCGTFQLDFFLPKRLGASYVTESGAKETPVMLHRAVLGSLERFIGIMLEHYAGDLPLWLSPQPVMVLTLTDRQHDYARSVAEALNKKGISSGLDLRNEKIGFKIRQHTIARVSYLLVLGDQEVQTQTITVRTRGGEQTKGVALDDFIHEISQKIKQKI